MPTTRSAVDFRDIQCGVADNQCCFSLSHLNHLKSLLSFLLVYTLYTKITHDKIDVYEYGKTSFTSGSGCTTDVTENLAIKWLGNSGS